MRRTTDNKITNRHKSRSIRIAASALALIASLSGASALADHRDHRSYDNHRHDKWSYSQDDYRYGPIYWKQEQRVRVKIPVRDHGPETLPLKRMINQNSDLNLERYRLVAVVTRNGRFSNGFASLRTGHSKTERYFLGSRDTTRIPAPSRADDKWRLRLGPGTQVRSVTAVLEPRNQWGYRKPANHRHASVYDRGYQNAQSAPWVSLAWMLANAEDDKRDRKQKKRIKRLREEQARTEAELAETQRKLERSRDRNKRLKNQRERLAEELAYERIEERDHKRGDKQRKGKRQEDREREVRRTVRYVVSAN